MKKQKWIDLLERALWTFWEGFVVALPVSIGADMDGAAWKAALMSAAMAGVSAIKTALVAWLREKSDE